MNLRDAKILARGIMAAHGLIAQGWRFGFDRSIRRFGCCNYKDRLITLSRTLCKLNDVDRVKNTVLHEIAHAIVGKEAGHGLEWKVKAMSIGCDGQRLYRSNAVVLPSKKWKAVCATCGKMCGMYSRRLTLTHRHCGGKLTYQRNAEGK